MVYQMNKLKVGSVLKHFPGYGDAKDTHITSYEDNRSLNEFMNNDLSGATVLDSSGMGHLISNQFPMFSMFAELDDEKENNSKTILKVVRSIEERERTEELVEKIIGDFKDPDTAIMISLPVSSAKGINY